MLKLFTRHSLLAALLVLTRALQPQGPPQSGTGLAPFGSFITDKVDTVDMSSGNLNLVLPLMTYAQRGNLTLGYSATYNAKNWAYSPQTRPDQSIYYVWQWTPDTSVPLFGQLISTTAAVLRTYSSFQPFNNPPYNPASTYLGLQTGDGGYHSLATLSASTPNTYITSDGTAYRVVVTPGSDANGPNSSLDTVVVTDRSGRTYQFYGFNGPTSTTCDDDLAGANCTTSGTQIAYASSVTDANGNSISLSDGFSATIDTVGNRIAAATVINSDPSCMISGSESHTTSFVSVGGAAAPVTLCTSIHNFNHNGATITANPIRAVDQIILANTTSWKFQYDSYGDVTEVDLPSGGYITYTWESIVPCVRPYDHTPTTQAIASRTVHAGTDTYLWTYTWGSRSSANTYINTVTDPLGNETDITFSELQPQSCGLYETKRDVFQGPSATGQLLRTIAKSYSSQFLSDGSGNAVAAFAVPVDVVTTLADATPANATTTHYDYAMGYGSYTSSSIPFTANVTAAKTYGYAAVGSLGPLLREVDTQYRWTGSPSYFNGNLLDLPSTAITKDGSGKVLSETDYGYDEDNGSPQGAFGNRTSTTYVNTNGPSLVTSAVYNTSGMATRQTKGTVATSINYQCSGAFPKQVTNALGHNTLYTYDCPSGLVTAIQDPNDIAANRLGQQYSYNSSKDLTSITNSDNGTTTVDYHSYTLPLIKTSTISAAPDADMVQVIQYDSLGRSSQTTGADGYITTTTYDAFDRLATRSNPTTAMVASPSSSTDGTTSFTYDALGRTLLQCQPDNGSVAGACVAGTSYLGWTYAGAAVVYTDENGNAWTRSSDALDRLVYVAEPGGMISNYSYDALGNLSCVDQWGGRYSRRSLYEWTQTDLCV